MKGGRTGGVGRRFIVHVHLDGLADLVLRLSQLPDPPPLAVNEVPLLYEAGAEGRFDAVVVIVAPRELRARRTLLDEREERLIPDEEKVRRADFSYVNDGSLDELDAFVAGVVSTLTER